MKIIGITGGSGSGKSYFVKKIGFKAVDADKIARTVTDVGSPVLKKLAECFGDDILCENGELNRKALAKKAFSSKAKTDLLNSITHPAIVEKIKSELDFHRKNGEKTVILDAPQLFEAGCDALCDLIVGVLADRELRLDRIIKRDGIDRENAINRINVGKDDSFFIENCDIIVYNNGDEKALEQQMLKLKKIL